MLIMPLFLPPVQLRHNVRPHFQTSESGKQVYDVITWAGTQVAISYTVVPFVLLAVGPSLKFYRYAGDPGNLLAAQYLSLFLSCRWLYCRD